MVDMHAVTDEVCKNGQRHGFTSTRAEGIICRIGENGMGGSRREGGWRKEEQPLRSGGWGEAIQARGGGVMSGEKRLVGSRSAGGKLPRFGGFREMIRLFWRGSTDGSSGGEG
ncbi:hypothetical protein CRG98_002450 [Punica granatum]|uniref:Uncharacterized protein n=1 Tax=Punica granatum TaxID=22663 RepID=A0A2I0L8Y6_PUNGR|nr:hypothetical protein CRG98_002450 [Punica granatum]